MALLTVTEAAQRLGTTPRFVRRLVAERRIPYVKLGTHVRLDDRDIDAFIAAGRIDPQIGRWPLYGSG
jgi:excisionase family DNA binding protein